MNRPVHRSPHHDSRRPSKNRELSKKPIQLTLEGVAHEHRRLLSALDAGKDAYSAVRDAYGWHLEAPVPEMILGQIDQIVIRQLNDFIPDNDAPLILDCGANVGISALHFKRCFPKAQIIAFEPDRSLFALLTRNLARNGAADVEAVEAAVWTSDGQVSFAADGIDGGRIDTDAAIESARPVRTVDLNSYLRKSVDLLKLDVEGAEYALVRHLFRRLRRVKNVVIECHINQSTIASFGTLLQQLGQSGFHVAFDTFGHWRDLIRGKPISSWYFEQYVAVYGQRSPSAVAAGSSSVPYLELSALRDFYRAHEPSGGPRDYQATTQARLLRGRQSNAVNVSPPFNHHGGRCWTVTLPPTVSAGDTLEHPRHSPLLVFEDGKPIGPPHCEHAIIGKDGAGRYSHWHNVLFFSTSDDSDPNTNQRTYSIALEQGQEPEDAAPPKNVAKPEHKRKRKHEAREHDVTQEHGHDQTDDHQPTVVRIK